MQQDPTGPLEGLEQRRVLMLEKRWLSPPPDRHRGVELFNERLLAELAGSGCLMTTAMAAGWLAPGDSAVVPCVSPRPCRGDLWGGLSASFKIRRRRFDVLLLANVANGLTPALTLLRMWKTAPRCVLIAHREPSPRFLRALARWPAHIVAVSGPIAGRFTAAGFRDVIVRYGVVRADRFFPREDKAAKETVDFCVLGDLDAPWKGADTAAAAFRMLPEEIAERCRLHLMSFERPPDFGSNRIRAYAPMPAEHVPAFLRDMDVIVVPSRDEHIMRETFSQAMVQGMLTGLPAIVSDLPVLTEKLDDGGGVTCRGVEQFTRAMADLARDTEARERMGRQARATALARYTWDTQRFLDESLFRTRPTRYDTNEGAGR